MSILRALVGAVLGFALAFGFYYGALHFAGVGGQTPLMVGLVAGVIGFGYSAVAFSNGVYEIGFFSILGYVLDMTWSLLNTLAGFAVWMTACKAFGGTLVVDDNSKRSGTFAFDKNPRGGGYDATTVGTVIGGGWSSHEEVHVWQARLFGPVYLLAYGVCLVLNLIARLVTGKTTDATFEAYRRICWEDWAYLGGSVPGSAINWGGWVGGLLLCTLYVGLILLIPFGIAFKLALVVVAGIVGLLLYTAIRTFTPAA